MVGIATGLVFLVDYVVHARSSSRPDFGGARLRRGRRRPTYLATDPDRAAGLIADAESIAQSITSNGLRAKALADITGTLAATHPDRAERIVQSITREVWKARALADVAMGLAATDPDRAERIAQSGAGRDCGNVESRRVVGHGRSRAEHGDRSVPGQRRKGVSRPVGRVSCVGLLDQRRCTWHAA